MLISVRNMELTYELHKAIKLNFINALNYAVVVRRVSKHFTWHMIPSCIEELITLLTVVRARLSAQAQQRIFQTHRGRRNADTTLIARVG